MFEYPAIIDPYRRRDFKVAWQQTLQSENSSNKGTRAFGLLTQGRICFEFGRNREALTRLLRAAQLCREFSQNLGTFDAEYVHSVADYATILAFKSDLAEGHVRTSLKNVALHTGTAKQCYQLLVTDFLVDQEYREVAGELAFSLTDSPELMIEKLRAHRRAIRSARTLGDRGMYRRTVDDAERLYREVKNRLPQTMYDASPQSSEPLGSRYSRYLGMVPFRTTFQYLQAGLAYDVGDLRKSLTLFEELIASPAGAGHVAARIGHVRVARELGHDVIALCEAYGGELHSEGFSASGGLERGEGQRFMHIERALLIWTQASNEATARPQAAIELCKQADELITVFQGGRFETRPEPSSTSTDSETPGSENSPIGVDEDREEPGCGVVPTCQSYSAIGYHLRRGDERSAMDLAKMLLEGWDLKSLTEFLRFEIAEHSVGPLALRPPAERLKEELTEAIRRLSPTAAFPRLSQPRCWAALLAIADLLRGVGRIPEAVGWYEAILHSTTVEVSRRRCPEQAQSEADFSSVLLGPNLHHAEGEQVLARLLSLLNLFGLHEDVIEIVELVDEEGLGAYGEPKSLVSRQTKESLDAHRLWSDEVAREVGLANIGRWQFDEARRQFSTANESITRHGRPTAESEQGGLNMAREDVAMWRLNGLVDIARRDPESALDTTKNLVTTFKRYRQRIAPLSPTAEATVAIAEAWVELQHGDSGRGLRGFVKAIGLAPHDVSGWIGLVRCLRVKGRHNEAIALLDWLREPDRLRLPGSLQPADSMGSPMDFNDIARGVHLRYRSLLHVERGWCYFDLDEFDRALEAFESAEKGAPYIISGQRGRLAAMINLEPGQVDQRIVRIVNDVEQWLARINKPDNHYLKRLERDLQIEGGRLMSRLGHYAKADELFERYLRSERPIGGGPADRRPQLRLLRIAEAHLDANRKAAARRILQQFDTNQVISLAARSDRVPSLTLKPNTGKTDRIVQLFRIRWLLMCRESKQAKGEIERLLKSENDNGHPRNEHISVAHLIVLFEHRLYEEALAEAARGPAAAEDPLGSDIRRIVAAWSALASAELKPHGSSERRRRIDLAEDSLEKTDRSSVDEIHLDAILMALRYGPPNRRLAPEGSQHDREALSRTSVIVESIGHLDRALARRPYSGALRRDKAALLIALNRLSEASAELKMARRTALHDARIELLTGVVAYREADYAESISRFQYAVDLDPRDQVHHRALAVAYFADGQPDEAMAAVAYGLRCVPKQPADARVQLEATAIELLAMRLRQVKRRQQFAEYRRLVSPKVRDILSSPPLNKAVRSEREATTALAIAEIQSVRGLRLSAMRYRRKVRSWGGASSGFAGGKSPNAESDFDVALWRRVFLSLCLATLLVAYAAVVVNALLPAMSTSGFPGTASSGWLTVSVKGLRNDLWPLVMLGPASFGIALFVLLFYQRLTGLKVGNVFEATLEAGEPVPEIVHVDLDMSVSRLLIISGFSHFRPEVRNFFHDDRSLFGH